MTDTTETVPGAMARERVLRAVAATRTVETPILGSMAVATLYSILGLRYGRGGFEEALAAADEATLTRLLEQIAPYEPALAAISAPEAQREGSEAPKEEGQVAFEARHEGDIDADVGVLPWEQQEPFIRGIWARVERAVRTALRSEPQREGTQETVEAVVRRAIASQGLSEVEPGQFWNGGHGFVLNAGVIARAVEQAGLPSKPQREGLAGRLAGLIAALKTAEDIFSSIEIGAWPAAFDTDRKRLAWCMDMARGGARHIRSGALALHATSQPIPQEGGRVPDGWLPIETAPKDGTKVDLWVVSTEHDKAERQPNAYWNRDAGEWQLGNYHAGQYTHRPRIAYWRPIPSGPGAAAPQPPAPSAEPDALAALKDENDRLKREADGEFVRAAVRVMQAHPEFNARDYTLDGITADDFETFFSEDMAQAWAEVESLRAQITDMAIAQAETGTAGASEAPPNPTENFGDWLHTLAIRRPSPEPSRQGVEAMRDAAGIAFKAAQEWEYKLLEIHEDDASAAAQLARRDFSLRASTASDIGNRIMYAAAPTGSAER